ncbi:hypothetical protein I552_4533 [Mycobacterium xenopi 3993]|nr:hypothetical protein I552_4533 [Mycobacterium xenopi 3993]
MCRRMPRCAARRIPVRRPLTRLADHHRCRRNRQAHSGLHFANWWALSRDGSAAAPTITISALEIPVAVALTRHDA